MTWAALGSELTRGRVDSGAWARPALKLSQHALCPPGWKIRWRRSPQRGSRHVPERERQRGPQDQLALLPHFTDGNAEAREGGGSHLKAALLDWPPVSHPSWPLTACQRPSLVLLFEAHSGAGQASTLCPHSPTPWRVWEWIPDPALEDLPLVARAWGTGGAASMGFRSIGSLRGAGAQSREQSRNACCRPASAPMQPTCS